MSIQKCNNVFSNTGWKAEQHKNENNEAFKSLQTENFKILVKSYLFFK